MSWLSRLTRPTVKVAATQKEIPNNYWDRCPTCGAMLYHAEIEKADFVCPYCDYHFRLPVLKRMYV